MSNTINHVSIRIPTNNEQIEDKTKNHNCLSIIREFSLNTTAHGLPGIARSESIYNCIYWTIALLIFTAAMIYLIVVAILNYFDYPTQIDLSIDSEWPQYFPAFSFCNVGALRLDKFMGPFSNYSNTSDTTITSYEQIILISDFIRITLNKNETLEQYYYPLSSMLYSCSYNNVRCTSADFIPFITTSFGLCYTFNAKLKNESDDDILYGHENGGVGRLDLGLYVHSHQYLPYLIDNVGIISLIHDNKRVPLMDSSGYYLIPNQKHIFSYRKKSYTFLSSPYTKCNDEISSWMQTMFNNYPGTDYKYSQNLCIRLSLQMYTYVKCKCVNPVMWDTRLIISSDTNNAIYAPLCDIRDSCFIAAVFEYMNSSFNSNIYRYECPQECSTTEFILKKSSLATPLEWQMSDIKSFVEKSSILLPSNWSNEWREYIHTNYLAVSILRETTTVENNTQQATLSLVDVFSNIGGQTGLWIGISLLSIMEVIEMFYRLIRYQCHRIRLANQRRKKIMT